VNGIEAPLAGAIDVSLTYFPSDLMQPPLERLNFRSQPSAVSFRALECGSLLPLCSADL
jgi:hypothetical protein